MESQLSKTLIGKSASRLPLTMSMPLAKALMEYDNGNYRDSLTLLLDFFEMSVQWLNCYFLGLACAVPAAAADGGARRAVKFIDAKRPLSFGDSVNELFVPLLKTMQGCCPEHPLVAALCTHVAKGKTNILSGSATRPGVIKIRNNYKGHGTMLAQSKYREAVDMISPHLEAMLLGLQPLTEADVHCVTSDGTAVSVLGKWNSMPQTPEGDIPGHYYVGFGGFPRIDLYPLVITKLDRYICVFQTLKDEKVKYESSDENIYGFETDSYNADFDRFLKRISPGFDISKEANWDEILDCASRLSSAYIRQVKDDKKYSSELFVDRTALTGVFTDFIRSGRTLLPLKGDAGQGKTNQLCYWAESLLAKRKAVLMFGGSGFAETSLPVRLREIFGVSPRKDLGRLLSHIHAKAEESGEYVYFLFDAVNECLSYNSAQPAGTGAPVLLFTDILSSLVSGSFPRFKVVTTCRSYTWKNQILPFLPLPGELTYENDEASTVVGFSDSETESAYRNYVELYQMLTPFEKIDRRIRLRLRDPLMMNFVSSNYVGESLSDEPADYSSVALFAKMISDIREKSFAGRKQCEILDELSDYIMRSYLRGEAADSVTDLMLRPALADAGHPLHRLSTLIYGKNGLSVAYTELLNRRDRPILRESAKTAGGVAFRSVEFIYERFLEYMLAGAFLRMHPCPSAADYVSALGSGSLNVVFIDSLRNAVVMEIERTADFGVLLDLISRHQDKPGVTMLVNEVLDVLIAENFEPKLGQFIPMMLSAAPSDPGIIGRFNELRHLIASNKATAETIASLNHLAGELAPTVSLRNAACLTVKNMLLTDYFNENLYGIDTLGFLLTLITDEIEDVSNEACKSAYYLSRRTSTHSHTPLRENLTRRIIREMYADIRSRTIAGNLMRGNRRRAVTFVEAATRLATLLIIDATVAPVQDKEMISEMLGEIKGIASYFTWKFRLVKMFMPFFQTIMRRQLTFQSVYVNNIVEYQGFWTDGVVPASAPEGSWSRPRLKEAMEFVGFYNRHGAASRSEERERELQKFRRFLPMVKSAYLSGCSFSYFIMERILVIVGTADWSAVREVFTELLSDENRGFEWFDYMQMSLLYCLTQIEVHSAQTNSEIIEIFTREAEDWTARCRGLFKARYSHKANPTGLYKRNVATWYCASYCHHGGDNIPREGDTIPVPVLYRLIDTATAGADKELLFHLLDNIAELISDFGYVKTGLAALRYIMTKYTTREQTDLLDNAPCGSRDYGSETLLSRIGSVLSTAKTYFPEETDAFLRAEIAGLPFPGVESFRDEIINYNSGGEKLSDLFTHKFGNFLIWSLLNEKEVDDFAYEAVCAATETRDCFAWFDRVIHILSRKMFNIEI